MISVITCARRPLSQSIQERNVKKTIGAECEYVLIDGSNNVGLAAAYNYGLTQVHGDIIVFIHDDAYFMKMNWGQILEAKFANDPWLGVVGVAGSQYLLHDKCSLTAAGRPFIKGRVVYHLQNGDFFMVVFSPENGDFEVVACDGVFFAMRASLFQAVAFDESAFTSQYFHDLDICMQARYSSRVIVTTDIVVKRRSQEQYGKEWQRDGQLFLNKWAEALPAATVDGVPNPDQHGATQCVNLKGKAPIETIC